MGFHLTGPVSTFIPCLKQIKIINVHSQILSHTALTFINVIDRLYNTLLSYIYNQTQLVQAVGTDDKTIYIVNHKLLLVLLT